MQRLLFGLAIVVGVSGAYGMSNTPNGSQGKVADRHVVHMSLEDAFDGDNAEGKRRILMTLASDLTPIQFAGKALTLISRCPLGDRVDHLAAVITRLKSSEHAQALSADALSMISYADARSLETKLRREKKKTVVNECLAYILAPRMKVQTILEHCVSEDRARTVAQLIRGERNDAQREMLLCMAIPMLAHKERIQLHDELLKDRTMNALVTEVIDPMLSPKAQVESILSKWEGNTVKRLVEAIEEEENPDRADSLFTVIMTDASEKERAAFVSEIAKKAGDSRIKKTY